MRAAEVVASRVLFWGGVLSVLLMTLGIVGFAARGGLSEWGAPGAAAAARASTSDAVFTSVGEVARALGRWPVEPLAVVAGGILLLIATPLAGVVAIFAVFAKAGDRKYAGVSAMVLGALLVSLVLLAMRR